MRKTCLGGLLLAGCLWLPATGAAAVVAISDPFSGILTESFESFPNYHMKLLGTGNQFLDSPTAIMGGQALLFGGSIYESGIPTLGLQADANAAGFYAEAHDGSKGVQFGNPPPLDIVTSAIVFSTPVTRFGGWWGTNPVGGANVFSIGFFDTNGIPIAPSPLSVLYVPPSGHCGHFTPDGRCEVTFVSLEWHGWQFDTPAKTVLVTGFGTTGDSLQADPIPEPSALLTVAAGVLVFTTRKHYRRVYISLRSALATVGVGHA